MSRSPPTGRNRYRTPLPFEGGLPEDVLDRRHRQESRLQRPRGTVPGSGRAQERNREQVQTPAVRAGQSPKAVHVQYTRYSEEGAGTTGREKSSEGAQSVILTDSQLPYQRPKRNLELETFLAELEQSSSASQSHASSTSREKFSSHASQRSATLSSRTNPSDIGVALTDSKATSLEAQRSRSRSSAPDADQGKERPEEQNTPPRSARLRIAPESPPPPLPSRGRTRSLHPRPPPASQPPAFEEPRPLTSGDELPASTAGLDGTEARRHNTRTSSLSGKPQVRSQTQPPNPKPPPSVLYEKVEGISLDTRPRSRKEFRTGLTIPEIEARDIRKIAGPSPPAQEGKDPYFYPKVHYAPSPPAIGAAPDYVRSIAPRAPHQPGIHTFVDRYSRAGSHEPAPPASGNVQLSKALPPVPRDNSFETPSENSADCAEPPEVARWRAFQEQEAGLTTRTGQAKLLLSNMIKSLKPAKTPEQPNGVKGPLSHHASRSRTLVAAGLIKPDDARITRGTTSYSDDTPPSDDALGNATWPPSPIWHPDDRDSRSAVTPTGKQSVEIRSETPNTTIHVAPGT